MATASTTTGWIATGSISTGSITFTDGTGTGTFGSILQPICANTTLTTTTSTASIAADNVWQGWVNVGPYNTDIDSVYYETPWRAWVEDDEARIERLRRADELQALREQQSRERLAREQERMENQLVAHGRALELLDDLLTEEERELRAAENRVAVQGSDGHLYWIEMHRDTVHGNIVRTDEHGCSLGRACVAPQMYGEDGALPTPDGWVGQYLGLKFDAEQFLSHANWSGRVECHLVDAAAIRQAAA